jgi:hypothetical protein
MIRLSMHSAAVTESVPILFSGFLWPKHRERRDEEADHSQVYRICESSVWACESQLARRKQGAGRLSFETVDGG